MLLVQPLKNLSLKTHMFVKQVPHLFQKQRLNQKQLFQNRCKFKEEEIVSFGGIWKLTCQRYNVGLKKEMEALMFSTDMYAMNVNNALAKVQEAVKKCQAEDVEKCSFEGDLSTIKQEKVVLQQ
ncbi:hypothetical protein KY289_036897 [Solanum tuberosum]|nr:hypothetical protein KY284_036724 [Solanum tuberosum]KAH0636982.1 hypothetical protein KY289_036897 [Solanum tuberosum]